MIAFLTQYVYGLGHSNRTKLIAEETAKYHDVLIIEAVFRPPLNYKVPVVSFLENMLPPDGTNLSVFVNSEKMISLRIKKFIETLNKYPIKTMVIEGFPFCRHQYAHEYFTFVKECKNRGITMIGSARDFPWDDPHDDQLKDWVNYSQNLVCNHYYEKFLIHGDPDILPLYSDRTRFANSKQVIDDIKDKIIYTGYVSDSQLSYQKEKNNYIYVSTGLNKEEGLLLFKQITKIAHKFPEYKFVMPVANRYKNLSNTTRQNMIFVDYIPNLGKRIQSCAAFISYAGYNTTMEVLKGRVPTIFVPRQDGQKLEQFVRCYAFEPYGFFKVVNNQEFGKLEKVLREVLNSTPNEFNFNMNGVVNSAYEIRKIHESKKAVEAGSN